VRITRQQLRRVIREEARRLSEAHGNVQSEPEFGNLLNAIGELIQKGFDVEEIMDTVNAIVPGGSLYRG
jgi:hypothetical protein